MSSFQPTLWSPISNGITAPKGFKASGVSAGLKFSGKPDLALLLAPKNSVCAGTFTQSFVRASCVDLCKERLKRNCGKARAVLINSGHANACTGDRGLEDSLKASIALAKHLNLMEDEVLICSTGVIGEQVPINKLLLGLEPLVNDLCSDGGDDASKAIMTTDLINKQTAYEALLGGQCVRIGGMAKGSGMIHPNMATMLGFLTCDARVPAEIWSSMIQRVVQSTFNSITVDGDTSTNDSFIAFSSGSDLPEKYFKDLEIGLKQVTENLAKAIARDGEGANCLIEVEVKGAQTFDDARKIARTVCNSSLVKTAVHGADPNWGRIVAACGRAEVPIDLGCVSISIGPYSVMEDGKPIDFDRNLVSAYMQSLFKGSYLKDDILLISINLGLGNESAKSWGCDFSEEYIRINAEYTT